MIGAFNGGGAPATGGGGFAPSGAYGSGGSGGAPAFAAGPPPGQDFHLPTGLWTGDVDEPKQSAPAWGART